ncbi:hypothetical protein HZS_8021, partial [Henneguya salminicola]
MNSSKEPAKFYDSTDTKPPKRKHRLTLEEAQKKGSDDPVRVYADGIFDIFHFGHARVLMQAKLVFPNVYLIVGVCSDEVTHRKKGQTVFSEEERYLSVLHCRYVDEVVRDAPWIIPEKFLDEHRIDFVAHDDIPYASSESKDVYAHIKTMGMFITTQRTPNVSTSDIITRIVRNYDNYVRRNLFRGYSRYDLNLGRKLNHIENMSDNLLRVWERKSHQLVSRFINLFVGNSSIALLLNEGRSMVLDILRNNDEKPDDDSDDSRCF